MSQSFSFHSVWSDFIHSVFILLRNNKLTKKDFRTTFEMELCSSSDVCFSLNFSLHTLWNLCPSYLEMPSVSLSILVTEHMNIYKYKLCLMDRKLADTLSFFSACERISLWREQFVSCFCLRDGAMNSLDKRKCTHSVLLGQYSTFFYSSTTYIILKFIGCNYYHHTL